MNITNGSRKYFSEDQKLRIIQEVLSGRISKERARHKYDIKGHSAILNWMRSFGISSLKTIEQLKASKKEKLVDARIKELEEALKTSELKAEAYSKMIDIAEQEFKIKIRKKSHTKQSKQ